MILFYFLFWMVFSAIVHKFKFIPNSEEYPLAVCSAVLVCCALGVVFTVVLFDLDLLNFISFARYCVVSTAVFFIINFIVIRLEKFLGNLWS